jgi:hypothetical protein
MNLHLKSIHLEFIKHAINITNPHTTFIDYIHNRLFIHPQTRNKVLFHSLPPSTQKFIKSQYENQKAQALYNLLNRTNTQSTPNFYPGAHHAPNLKHILGYL